MGWTDLTDGRHGRLIDPIVTSITFGSQKAAEDRSWLAFVTMGGVKPRSRQRPNRTRQDAGTKARLLTNNESATELQAGIGTSPGKPGESGSGLRRGTARAPADMPSGNCF